jgi:hypothetical protein
VMLKSNNPCPLSSFFTSFAGTLVPHSGRANWTSGQCPKAGTLAGNRTRER